MSPRCPYILNGLGKDAAYIISRINGFTYVETDYDFKTGELKVVREKAFSDGERAAVKCYGANDVLEGVAIMKKEGVEVSITGNSTNPTRFQHLVAGTYKKWAMENGKKYFSVASGGGTGRTLHPDNVAAGPASYGLTDSMGRMHGDAQFAGSSSVPAHVEMMGLIGMGNNPMVDNHIYQGNALNIDPRRITWKRCVDMNDRQLRFITDGLGGKANGTPREDGFDITVASEVMAIFCLATDLADLKARLGRIVVGYTYAGAPVTAEQIGAAGAMAALLKDAFDPNLVQTLEHTPALVHGGPFANIAHGCNSVIATKLGMKLADYVVTEAGFGADLGAEKFLDIKCRLSGIEPSAVVVVATVRALKHHGGCPKAELGVPSLEYLEAGSANLARHVENMQSKFGMPVCVAINAFPTDSPEEHQYLRDLCARLGVPCALSEVFAKGGAGGLELAEDVLGILEKRPVRFTYPDDAPVADKVRAVCKNIYGAADVAFSAAAKKQLAELDAGGFGRLPVCIAKTQYSFSDDASLLAAPSGFTMTVRELRLSAGAGFVVVVMGNIMTMPGLPKKPAAEGIDVDENGVISGLF